MKKILIVLLISLALISCRKDEHPVLKSNDNLLGSWIHPQYNDTLITYQRADNLLENELGITFLSGNKLISRQNSGWCGTPPVTMADYDGIWIWNDSIVEINVGYWGGKVDYTWKVISLTSRELIISVVKYDYHDGK